MWRGNNLVILFGHFFACIEVSAEQIYSVANELITPPHKMWRGIVITFVCVSVCLCVCLSVCHFVCKHNNSRTNHSILMKFGQIVYNHNRKVKFEDGLCPLIFKATAVKKPLEMMKISHYKSYFQHIDVKFAQ